MKYTILYSKISYNISLVNNPFNKSAEYSILSQNLVSTAQRTDKILSAQLALYLLCSVILYQRRLAPAPGGNSSPLTTEYISPAMDPRLQFVHGSTSW